MNTHVFEKIIPLVLSFLVLHGRPEPLGLDDVHACGALGRHHGTMLVNDLFL